MNMRILYIVFAIVIVIIFIGILANIQSKNERINVMPKEEETAEIYLGMPSQASSAATVYKSAVTIIKPHSEEFLTPEEKAQKSRKPKKTSSLSTQPVSPGSGKADFAEEPASGAIKINKHPTEAENNEMNEKGIVIW